MARIRTIKPEFWGDEKLAPQPPVVRLVFLGLMSMADDAGRLVDNVKSLDGMLFPETDDTVDSALVTLARLSRIIRYRSESGQRLIQIVNWEKHQKVDKPSKYTLPAPSAEALERQRVYEHSRDIREVVAEVSRDGIAPTYDLRPTTPDQGPPNEEQHSEPNGSAAKPRLVPLEEIGAEEYQPPPGAMLVLGGKQINESDHISAGEIVGAWIRTRRIRPPAPVINKQSGAAKDLSEKYTAGEIVRAFLGITQIWPHKGKDGEPWDLFNLRDRIDKAIAAAEQHPDLKRQQNYADFLRELERAA